MSPRVFKTADGLPFNASYSLEKLHKYCKNNNLPDITSHRLRHTFASLTKDVLTSAEVKLTLGHSEAMNTDNCVHRLKNDHVKVG